MSARKFHVSPLFLFVGVLACAREQVIQEEKIEQIQPATMEVTSSYDPLSQVVVIENNSLDAKSVSSCSQASFEWIDWHISELETFSDKKLELASVGLSLEFSGEALKLESHLAPRRMFAEDLSHFGFTYPFRSILVSGSKQSYEANWVMKMAGEGLSESHVIAVGQLFRYSKDTLTSLEISVPGRNIEELFDVLQSAAAYASKDYDGQLALDFAGDKLKIYSDGLSGRNSEFLFLRPKPGVNLKEIHWLLRSNRWKGSKPDEIEIGVAKLNCGMQACRKAMDVVFYDQGDLERVGSRPKFSADALLALGDANGQEHYTSIAPGGRLELQLDGYALNHDGDELELRFKPGSCVRQGMIDVYARAAEHEPWQRLSEVKEDCEVAYIDLYRVDKASQVKIVNSSSRELIHIDALSCSPRL